MGVGAEQGGDPAVGKKSHGSFFPGGLRVKIHHDDLGKIRGFQQLFQGLKGAGQTFQIDRAHQVDHPNLDPSHIHNAHPFARCSGRVVCRAEQSFAGIVKIVGFPAAETVVAGGDHIHAAVQQVFRRGGGDPVSIGGIFPVGND